MSAKVVAGVAAYLVPVILEFTMGVIKHTDSQKRLEADDQYKKREAAEKKERKRLATEQHRKRLGAKQEQKEQDTEEMLKRLAAENEEKWEAAEQERKRQAAEQEQKAQAAEQMRKQEAAEHEEKWKAFEQMRKREAIENEEKWEAAEQMRKREFAEKEEKWKADDQVRKRRAAEEEAQQARKREAKQELERQDLLERLNLLMQDKHAQIGRERDTTKTLKQLKEEIERAKWEQQEANRMQDIKFKALMRTIADAFKLFMNYYQFQRQSMPLNYGVHPSRSQHQSLGYQERVRLLANFELAKDSDKDLHNIFVKSCLLLEDNGGSSLDTAGSSKHPMFARDVLAISELPVGFEDDILSMVMTTINDAENPQVTNLWALHNQVFGGSEDDVLSSSVMTSRNNVEATRAKEEGDAYFREQKFEEAIECYSKSIDELPTAAAYANRAMTYIKLNKLFEADYDCTDALEIDKHYFKAYARRAMARTKLGFNLVGALEDVQAALKLEPNNQEMKKLCAQLMSSKGTSAKEKGNAYFKVENFEEAIECYSKSIDELPTAAAYGNRAMAYIKLNKFIEAEMDCTEALKIDDRYFKAYARRAMARTKLGCNLKDALEDAQVALKLESNNQEMEELSAQLMSLLKAATEAKEEGNNYFKNQKFEDAIICYSASINKSPTAVAYCNRAMAYLKLDKLMEAENDCTEALTIDDQYFKAYARRATARSKIGLNLEGALGDVETALNLEPNNQEMKELHAKLIEVLG